MPRNSCRTLGGGHRGHLSRRPTGMILDGANSMTWCALSITVSGWRDPVNRSATSCWHLERWSMRPWESARGRPCGGRTDAHPSLRRGQESGGKALTNGSRAFSSFGLTCKAVRLGPAEGGGSPGSILSTPRPHRMGLVLGLARPLDVGIRGLDVGAAMAPTSQGDYSRGTGRQGLPPAEGE